MNSSSYFTTPLREFLVRAPSITLAVPPKDGGAQQMTKKIKIGRSKTHCKCLCQVNTTTLLACAELFVFQYNVTESEMIAAIGQIRQQRLEKEKEREKEGEKERQ